MSSHLRASARFQKHSRVRALLSFISIGQLVALLHVDDQSLCLLLILQGKGNLAGHKDVAKIASFTIDAHHAANCTLKTKQPQTSGKGLTPLPTRLTSSLVIKPQSLNKTKSSETLAISQRCQRSCTQRLRQLVAHSQLLRLIISSLLTYALSFSSSLFLHFLFLVFTCPRMQTRSAGKMKLCFCYLLYMLKCWLAGVSY